MKQCEANHLPMVEFVSDALTLLSKLPYNGNIRELKNLVERTILISGKNLISAKDLEPQMKEATNLSNNHIHQIVSMILVLLIVQSFIPHSYLFYMIEGIVAVTIIYLFFFTDKSSSISSRMPLKSKHYFRFSLMTYPDKFTPFNIRFK